LLPQVKDVWPINEAAGKKPEAWPGWPDNKQFALVLTHDVESQAGLDRVRPLAELEMRIGFRSCFNFIPEGEYRVSKELRDWLTGHGFEVGVHDLYHDGRLYKSRQAFQENAEGINGYLEEWGAVGFRSGFMLHELDWLHDLKIQYDSSTFDTDPFEPQPDGTGTIFPFWVPRSLSTGERDKGEGPPQPANSGLCPPTSGAALPGYVELPYTMPQDSTLFLLFGEKSSQIWLKKLSWIALNGGLMLVNVHPDFLTFNGSPSGVREVTAGHYRDFLAHLRQHYAGGYWHALPRDAARFVSGFRPANPRLHRRRVAMVTYSFYESDNRVMRYAEALAGRGDEVEVVALKRTPDTPTREILQGVSVFRPQSRLAKREQAKLAYLLPLLRFLVSASVWLIRRETVLHYDLIHVHNIPDFMVFAAWFPKLAGSKVILDIHDIVPEFYASKFGRRSNSFGFHALKTVERLSARFANHVIISNHLWLETFVARSAPADKVSVFINYADPRVFYKRPRTRNDGHVRILFPGGLQWHQGLDIALRAFQKVVGQLPLAEFHIYGDGNMKASLVTLVSELGLQEKVRFFPTLPVRQVADIMANADLGIVPKRADSFGNEAYSTKIMEFMALGIPVVVSSTKIDRYYFNDSVVRFFESGNPDALAETIMDVLNHPKQSQDTIARAFNYAAHNSWEIRKQDYFGLVDSLCKSKGP
jgi:glycosyltransferase involved in cell wall biosynthesis